MIILTREQINKSGIIRITEVSLLAHPEDAYEYRGQLHALDKSGVVLLDQSLQVRRKPEWLINGQPSGDGPLTIALQARPYDTQHWEDISRVTFLLDQYLIGQNSAVIEQPIDDWGNRSPMQLRVRLSKAQTDEQFERDVSMTDLSKGVRPVLYEPVSTADKESVMLEELVSLPPLTPPEQVIVKDCWNKLLAFQDMLIEMFFERLLHEEPELIDRFGDAIDQVPTYFAALFDRTVRQLNPHTEQTLRESYGGIYPTPPDGFKSPEDMPGCWPAWVCGLNTG